MLASEIVSKMREEGRESVSHIRIGGSHMYYVSLSQLEGMIGNKDIDVLNWGTDTYLRTEDVMGKAPKTDKKRLYRV